MNIAQNYTCPWTVKFCDDKFIPLSATETEIRLGPIGLDETVRRDRGELRNYGINGQPKHCFLITYHSEEEARAFAEHLNKIFPKANAWPDAKWRDLNNQVCLWRDTVKNSE